MMSKLMKKLVVVLSFNINFYIVLLNCVFELVVFSKKKKILIVVLAFYFKFTPYNVCMMIKCMMIKNTQQTLVSTR